MTPAQSAFVARRAAQIRYWPWLGGALLLALVGLYAFLYGQFPLYASPDYLVQQLNAGKVGQQQLAQLAAMGNLAFLGCGAFIFSMLLFTFVALANEKRLIAIIREQEQRLPAAGEGRAPDAGASGD